MQPYTCNTIKYKNKKKDNNAKHTSIQAQLRFEKYGESSVITKIGN